MYSKEVLTCFLCIKSLFTYLEFTEQGVYMYITSKWYLQITGDWGLIWAVAAQKTQNPLVCWWCSWNENFTMKIWCYSWIPLINDGCSNQLSDSFFLFITYQLSNLTGISQSKYADLTMESSWKCPWVFFPISTLKLHMKWEFHHENMGILVNISIDVYNW